MHASRACECLCSDKQTAFEFLNCKEKRSTPSTPCRKMTNNGQKCAKREKSSVLIQESKHCCAHSIKAGHTQQQAAIDPSAAAVRAH